MGKLISLLKKKSRSNAIRWTKPENLHITLQFLANVESANLPKLITNVRTCLQGGDKNYTIQFGPLQTFPNPYRPRIIVLEIVPNDDLEKLATRIGEGVNAANYPLKVRPFRAHLTLGRIKRMNANLNFLSDALNPFAEKMPFDEIVLFQSQSQPQGSTYSVIDTIKLNYPTPKSG